MDSANLPEQELTYSVLRDLHMVLTLFWLLILRQPLKKIWLLIYLRMYITYETWFSSVHKTLMQH